MNAIVKVLTGVLAVLAVVACLATVGILGYSMIRPQDDEETVQNMEEPRQDEAGENAADAGQQPVPTTVPEGQSGNASAPTPLVNATPVNHGTTPANHVHDYEESIETKATCYRAGRLKYTCEDCGDVYYVDVMSTGHVAGDWEVSRRATAGADGLRVKKCIYCDEIVAQESVPYADANAGASASPGAGGEGSNAASGPHVHQYAANTEREPSCTLAGLRKYTCECGNFYTEMIPALGHVATDWEVAAAPTTTKMGTEQRTCSVCGVLLDSRPVNKLTSAAASGNSQTSSSAAPNASGGNGQSQASNAPDGNASPSASGHSHEYQSYILKHPTCTQEGIRSFICGCGSSYAESIERDLNSHTYRATIIPATSATQGYTVYTCVRCNYSYVDNYTPALGNPTGNPVGTPSGNQ